MPSASRRSPQLVLVAHRAGSGADEPNRQRPKRAPSSSAQLTSRTVSGGVPSSAIRRSTSTPATTLRQPSSQPPFGTESMWPPSSSARSEAPGSVNHWFPASSISSSAPSATTFSRSHCRAPSHVSVQATRCAPFSSPVSSLSSRSSATVRSVTGPRHELKLARDVDPDPGRARRHCRRRLRRGRLRRRRARRADRRRPRRRRRPHRSTRSASTSCRAASTRTRISTCRSAARSRSTTSSPARARRPVAGPRATSTSASRPRARPSPRRSRAGTPRPTARP